MIETGMNRYVCAADESSDENPLRNFIYGGFAAPAEDWTGTFETAWRERVLLGPPSIPFLHMTDIRSRKWRARYDLSVLDADRRVDEAARVIGSCGSLIPVVGSVDRMKLDERIARLPPLPPTFTGLESPDYLAFYAFAMVCAHLIELWPAPEVRRIDFHLERNDQTRKGLRTFHRKMAPNLSELGSRAAARIGELELVKKQNVATQAADVLCWHARNELNGSLDRWGRRRYEKMIGQGRFGCRFDMDELCLNELLDRLELKARSHRTDGEK